MGVIKRIFKGWNAFELVLLTVSVTVIPVLGIVYGSSVFELVASVGGAVASLFYCKGKIEGYFLSLVTMAFEIVAAWQVMLFATVFNIFAFAYPMVFFGILSWARNRRRDADKGRVVVIGGVKAKEMLIVLAVAPFVAVGVFFMLQAFGTKFLVVSTIMSVVGMVAAYLIARRSKMCFFLYAALDLINGVLWTLLLIEGHVGAVAIIAMCAIYFVMDIYAIIEWQRLQKRQETRGIVDGKKSDVILNEAKKLA